MAPRHPVWFHTQGSRVQPDNISAGLWGWLALPPGRWEEERVLVPSSQGRRASHAGAGTLGVLEVSSGDPEREETDGKS